jgi:hypothetical protein
LVQTSGLGVSTLQARPMTLGLAGERSVNQ